MSSNLHNFPRLQRLAVVFMLCAAIFGCEDQRLLTVIGPGGGGGGPTPGTPDPLTVTNFTPGHFDSVATTTSFIIEFDRAPTLASLTGRIEIRYIEEVQGTQDLVPLVRNTAFDGLLDPRVVIFDQASGELEENTSFNAVVDEQGRKRFYRMNILPGITAADGGMLETLITRDFGTGGPDAMPNPPSSIQINAIDPLSFDIFTKESDFELTKQGSGDETATVLLMLNADDGMGQPGDFFVQYTPGGGLNELVALAGAPAPPAEASYTVTVTVYDYSLNAASDTFTFVYDTLPPDAPTDLTRTDGMSGSVSATSIEVDAMFTAPPSDLGAYEVEITGGLTVPSEVVMNNPHTDIPVQLRRNQSNTLRAVAIDRAGNRSDPSGPLVIVQDDLPPTASVQWIPALALNTANTLTQTSATLRTAISSIDLVTIEVHSDDSMSNPIATRVVSSPITDNLVVDLSFVAPLDPPVTNLTVEVSDEAGNTAVFGPYNVRVDLMVDPEPNITRLCDANGPCLPVGTATGECSAAGGMVARSSSCLQYDLSNPGGYRTAQSNVYAYGTVEAGSALRFLPPGGLFVNGSADPISDAFPADDAQGPAIRAASSGGRFSITATDVAGNQVTVDNNAQLVTDKIAPEVPEYMDATTGMSCTLTDSTLDPVFDVVLSLEGPFSGQCEGLSLDFDLTDSASNPDRSLGESLLARVTTDTTYDSGAMDAVDPPAFVSVSVAGITLPASYENAINEFTVTAVDAVGNASTPLRIAVVHRTDSETVIPGSIEMLTNSGGDRDGQALDFDETGSGPQTITSRPTNADAIIIDGRTDPADDSVELLDNAKASLMPAVTTGADNSTGAFQLTIPSGSFSTDGTYTFYVRTTRTTMMGTQTEDVEVNITYDTSGPATVVTPLVSSPQGAPTAPVAVAIAALADPTGLDEVELVARRYSDAGCTMAVALPMEEVCEGTMTGHEACAPLDPSEPSYLTLTASIGEYVEVLFRDEAGNESTNTFPPRACMAVPTSRRLAALVKGDTANETGINVFNIDDATPTGVLTTDPLLTGPEQLQVYSPTRMFILDRAGGTSSVVHYSLDTATVEAAPPSVAGELGQMVARADRQIAAFLQTGSTESSVLAAAVDVDENIATLSGSSVTYFGYSMSNKLSTNMELFPDSVDPQGDWALVVRAHTNFLQVPPLDGDAIIFDLFDGSVVVPTGGFVAPTTPGLSVGPNPSDILIRSDGYYALVASTTGLGGNGSNETDTDLTVLDFSACTAATTGNCTQANFNAMQLALQDGSSRHVNGISGLVFIPGSDTLALGVELFDADNAGRVHLLSIDWATPAVTVEGSIVFAGIPLKAAIAITDDGSEAFVLANTNDSIIRIEIDTMAMTLVPVTGDAGTLEPEPVGSSFKTTFAPLP